MTSHSLDLRGNGEARASFDIAAEQELLGAVIFENETFHAVGEVAPEDFSEPFHQRLWAEIADRIGHGVQASPTGLARRFKDDGAFVALRGMAYIGDLVDRAPTARVAVAAAEIVRDEALRRRMAALAREMADAIATATGTAAEVLSASERAISDLARHGAHGDAWTGAGAITGAALAKAREGNGMVGLSTGLGDLDDAMGGLRKGQMIIVAGRPAMGKSTAALQLAKAVARKGRGAAFFSMEMPDFDLGLRLACDEPELF
jgi:replicative DNA helicase